MKKKTLRKCTGCNTMQEKLNLIRVVKTKENNFYIDNTFKLQGRGAYICNNIECFEKAFKNKGLERSFKSKIDNSIYEKLRLEFNNE